MGDPIKPKPIFMQEITGSTLFPNIQDTYYNVILFNLPIQLGIQKGHNKESIHVEDGNITLLGKGGSKIIE